MISIEFGSITDFGKKGSTEDVYKTFAFQLGQILALRDGVELYTKRDVADYFPDLTPYLYREKGTDFTTLQQYLDQFTEYCSNFQIEETDDSCLFIDFDRKVDLKNERYVERG